MKLGMCTRLLGDEFKSARQRNEWYKVTSLKKTKNKMVKKKLNKTAGLVGKWKGDDQKKGHWY